MQYISKVTRKYDQMLHKSYGFEFQRLLMAEKKNKIQHIQRIKIEWSSFYHRWNSIYYTKIEQFFIFSSEKFQK